LGIAFILCPPVAQARPSFTIGSDPYETVFAYPHDILRWPSRMLYLSYEPQSSPWQGDVTHPQNRPSASYTSNYQEVEFSVPYGYGGDPASVRSWARLSSAMNQRTTTTGGTTDTKYGRFLFEMGTTATRMNLNARGVARSEPSEGSYVLIPFKGSTGAQKDDYSLKVIHARTLFGNPLGVKVEYTRKTADQPDGYISFTRDATDYKVPRLTWGWATQGCNHIFGYPNINVDAFYQDHYTVFEGRQWDLQISFERQGNWKSGIRYRSNLLDGDSYSWDETEGSQFDGSYRSDPHWKNRETGGLLRGYTKASFIRGEGLDAGILFLLQRESATSTRVNKQVESEPWSKEGQVGYALETNPFFNFIMPRGYVDCGLLLELGRTGMRNTETRWNPASDSAQRDVLWSTSPNLGWTEHWEEFSKGRKLFFATGIEGSSSVRVYRGLSALMRVTILRQYTDTNKDYGDSEVPEGGASYRFFQSHRRDDFRRETWMTGAFGFTYEWRGAKLYATQGLPTSYLLAESTELADNGGTLFHHERRQMWQVQRPSGSRLFVTYALRP